MNTLREVFVNSMPPPMMPEFPAFADCDDAAMQRWSDVAAECISPFDRELLLRHMMLCPDPTHPNAGLFGVYIAALNDWRRRLYKYIDVMEASHVDR